jgi:large subunit ribosomal protein L28
MAQACEVCGKGPQMGNQVTTRGRAKYLGGVGTKVTGISRRQFKPNLRTVRVTTPNGAHKTVRICAKCLRSGAVTKLIHVPPFRLPGSEKAKAEKSAAPASAAQRPRAPAEYVVPEGVKIRKRKRDKKEDQAD